MPGNRKNILQTLAGYVNVGVPSLPVPSMESDPLGVGGAIAGAPEYGLNYNNLGNAMAQRALQQLNALNAYNQGPGSGWMPLGPAREATPFVTVQPLRVFIEARTKLLVDQLPYKVTARIARLEFTEDRILVCYDNMQHLELFDVDRFPSDEHIARILLDSP